MTDPYIIFDYIELKLREATDLVGDRVYTGTVPGDVTTDTWMPPYIVIWPGAGTGIGEPSVSTEPDKIGRKIRFMTTVAAHDVRTVLGVTGRLQALLSGLPVGSGIVRPVELQQEAAVVLTDTTVTPSRPYLPLAWNLQTNTNPQGDTP